MHCAQSGVRRSNSRQLIAWMQGSAGPAAPATLSPAPPRGAADHANAILTALSPVTPAARAERRPQQQHCPLRRRRNCNDATRVNIP